jgi:hypothetical protein
MTRQDDLDRRIREALGEGINPLYVRSLLEMSTPDLLRWLQTQCIEEAHTMATTIAVAEAENAGIPTRGGPGTYRFGLRLHKAHLELHQFILNELASRNDAVVVNALGDEPAKTSTSA